MRFAIAAFGLFAIVVVVSMFPWLMGHKGKSTIHRDVIRKTSSLITTFRARTGRWPVSFGEIESELHPDLSVEGTFYCDTHPWNHRETGTLEGAVLERSLKSPGPGIVKFGVGMPDALSALPVYVEDPTSEPRSLDAD